MPNITDLMTPKELSSDQQKIYDAKCELEELGFYCSKINTVDYAYTFTINKIISNVNKFSGFKDASVAIRYQPESSKSVFKPEALSDIDFGWVCIYASFDKYERKDKITSDTWEEFLPKVVKTIYPSTTSYIEGIDYEITLLNDKLNELEKRKDILKKLDDLF